MIDYKVMVYGSNVGEMDGYNSVLWTLYDEECDDYEIILAVFEKYMDARYRVLSDPLNDCGRYLDEELVEWLISWDIDDAECMSRKVYKPLSDCNF